ncbi:hypothetical protein [Salinifilum ghardaiensis]
MPAPRESSLGRGDVAVRETEVRCHELLLRLADRLPDRYLWRYRDWLAGGAADVLARVLPAALVRERISLPDDEQRLLAEALIPLGADPALVNAILPRSVAAEPDVHFSAQPPASTAGAGHSDVLVLAATLRGRAGVREVRTSWRHGPEPKRVVLITATADHIELAGEVQRVLRALGDSAPRVEVLPTEAAVGAHHRAALAAAELVCTGPEAARAAHEHGEHTAGSIADARG